MKSNGNGRVEGTCPHACGTCRAIEAGLAGRPLAPDEFIIVSGGLVEQSREGRVEWSQETVDAQLAADVAQVAYESASRSWVEVDGLISSEEAKFRHFEGGERVMRKHEVEEAARVARADLEEAKKRLSACRARYHELAASESWRHGQALYAADQAQQEATRDARLAAKRGTLARLLSAVTK